MSPVIGNNTRPEKPMTVSDPLRILYVDDESVLRTVCKIYLGRRGITVTTAASVQEAFTHLATSVFDVILSDYQMPETDGIAFLKILQERNCQIPFILFTGKGREEVVIEAIDHGATFYMQKGGDPKSQFAELEQKIREASRRHKAEMALTEREIQYATLFENSGTAIVIFDEAGRISTVNTVFCTLTGFARQEIEGTLSLTDFLPGADKQRLARGLRMVRLGLLPQIQKKIFRIAAGNHRILIVSATITPVPESPMFIASMINATEYLQKGWIRIHKHPRLHIPPRYQQGNPSHKAYIPDMLPKEQAPDLCIADRHA